MLLFNFELKLNLEHTLIIAKYYKKLNIKCFYINTGNGTSTGNGTGKSTGNGTGIK